MIIRHLIAAVIVVFTWSVVLASFASFPNKSKDANDWHHYQRKLPFQRTFEETGILYRHSVLSRQEYDAVHKSLQQLQLLDEKASIAHNRIGAVVPSTIYPIFKEGSLCRLVQSIMGDDYELSNDISIEVRVYEKKGAGMDWHVDDVLYDPPQVEVVWTKENTSDCTTRWINTRGEETIIETDPNSVLLLKAGVVPHCVTPLKRGRRVIVKCALCSKHAVFHQDNMVMQFATNKSKKKRRKR